VVHVIRWNAKRKSLDRESTEYQKAVVSPFFTRYATSQANNIPLLLAFLFAVVTFPLFWQFFPHSVACVYDSIEWIKGLPLMLFYFHHHPFLCTKKKKIHTVHWNPLLFTMKKGLNAIAIAHTNMSTTLQWMLMRVQQCKWKSYINSSTQHSFRSINMVGYTYTVSCIYLGGYFAKYTLPLHLNEYDLVWKCFRS